MGGKRRANKYNNLLWINTGRIFKPGMYSHNSQSCGQYYELKPEPNVGIYSVKLFSVSWYNVDEKF